MITAASPETRSDNWCGEHELDRERAASLDSGWAELLQIQTLVTR